MNLAILAALLIFVGYLVSLFGSKITPEHSFKWWLYFVFLFVFAINPNSLNPITHFFGITLTGNFFLATTCLFLLFQCLENASESWGNKNQLRSLVSAVAANEFVEKIRDGRLIESEIKALVVLPCLNEEECIENTIRQISESKTINFCVINDHSRDRTLEILQLVAPGNFTSHQVNLGVSGALMTGFKICETLRYDYCVQFDSDGQHPASKIGELLDFAKSTGADLVVGSRFLGKRYFEAVDESTTFARQSGSALLRFLLNYLFKVKTTDPTSGFRVYSKKAMQILLENLPQRYPEPETIAMLAIAGARIQEFGVQMNPRQGGVSSLAGKRKAFHFMLKVTTSLVALRLRNLNPRGKKR